MRLYELTYIISSDVDEQEYNAAIAQVQKWIEEAGGKMVNIDQWGRRKLAYDIGEFSEGFYVSFQAEMNPQSTAELERSLRLFDKVIRHLLVRADERD